MKLQPLMTMKVSVKQPATVVGSVPLGQRVIGEVIDGSFEGERLSGTIITPGADWVLIGDGGIGHIDVRLTLKTHDDVLIYMQYIGKLVFNDKFNAASRQGTDMKLGDTYFMIQPRFETGAADYAWLNSIVAVAEGRMVSGGVEYKVYECQHD